MKLIDTFEILEGVLYSTIYDTPAYGGEHEFRRLLNQWNDRKYLVEYFERNKKKLQTPFWNKLINGDPSIEVEITQAVNLTIEEASEFEQEILDIANGNSAKSLDDIFKPLHKEFRKESEKFEFKAYGIYENSWLRFYAIKYENIYFITGGGIKLTEKMEDSEDLDLELQKLEKVYYYLFNDPDIDPELLDKLDS